MLGNLETVVETVKPSSSVNEVESTEAAAAAAEVPVAEEASVAQVPVSIPLLIPVTPPPETATSQPTLKTVTTIKIAAIDNGLAFPFKHPDEWRACNLIILLIIIQF